MLRVLNKEKQGIGLIDSNDIKISKEINTLDIITCSLKKSHELANKIDEEFYFENEDNIYIVKSKDIQKTTVKFEAILNVDEIKGKALIDGLGTKATDVIGTLRLAIAGTGWIIEDAGAPIKKRSIDIKNTSNAWAAVEQIIKKWKCEYRIDSKNKKIIIKDSFTQNKGVYFSNELNALSIGRRSETSNLITRLIPIGKDGLKINDINSGKSYVENFQYTDKVIEQVWEDNRYTIAEDLKEDAILKLDELSKPNASYILTIKDLASINPDEYGFLSYELGDIITIIDTQTNFKDEQRIVKMDIYKYTPNKNSVTIANKFKSFTDKQKEQEETTETVDLITNENGTIDGTKVENLKNNLEIHEIKVDILDAVKINVGELVANKADIDDLHATNAEIINLKAHKADVTELTAVSGKINILESEVAKIGVLEGDVANVKDVIAGNISSDNIQSEGITGDRLNMNTIFVNDANIVNVNASKVNAGEIDTSKVKVKSADGAIEIAGATQQFRDKNNKVRIQMGKDAKGDFNFIIKGEDGTTTLIDHTGVKESAIANDLIKDNMIAPDAVGEKQIDYDSFSTGFNKDTNTTQIKATKVKLDNQGQTLDVAFTSIKNQSDATKTQTESNTTQINIANGKIETAIANTTIVKDGKEVLLKDDYNTTIATVDSMKNTISSHTTKIDENTGKIGTVESKTNVLERDLNSMSSKISATETTVNTHTTEISTANTNASNAQSTANTAVTKADKAQTDANKNKADIITVNTEVTTTKNKVSGIEQDLNSVTTRIGSVESTTTSHTATINSHTSSLNAVDGKINTAKTDAINTAKTDAINTAKTDAINTAKSDAQNKANKALNDAKSYTGTEITKVNSTMTSKFAEIKTTTDSITQTVSNTNKEIETVKVNVNNAQSDATKAISDAKIAKTEADKGVANALSAQNTANIANTNANTANTNANTANNKLTEIASDSKLTASEKQQTKKDWDAIVGEKIGIIEEAKKFGISYSDYESKYNTLNNYITPLLSNLTTTSDITGATFRSNFTNYYNSRQALLNAISTKAKSLADTAKTQEDKGVNDAKLASDKAIAAQSTANSANNSADIATRLAQAMASGKLIKTDPVFKTGTNGCSVYNNSGGSAVTITRIIKPSDCPTSSSHCLEIKTTGSPTSPGWGGFVASINSKANAKFIIRIIAKIPTGRTLVLASNSLGTNGTDKLLTSNAGTGTYIEYIREIKCGSTGSFSSTGHFYLNGGSTPASSSPLIWNVALCEVYDITDCDYTLQDTIVEVTNVKNKTATLETNVNAITGRVSSVESTTSTLNGKVTAHESRISSAEQKITSSAIINTVQSTVNQAKNDAINTANNNTTTKISQVTQSLDNFKVDIKRSGGGNLIKNASFLKGINVPALWNSWRYGTVIYPTTVVLAYESGTGSWAFPDSSVKTTQITVTDGWEFTGELAIRQGLNVQPYTDYTFSYYCSAHRVSQAYMYIRGTSGLLSSDRFNPKSGGDSLSNWTKIVKIFNTGNSTDIIIELGMLGSNGANPHLWIAKPMLSVGSLESEFTPSLNEVRGNTMTVDEEALECKFEDGTYTSMGRNGLRYWKQGMSRPYQYITFNAKVSRIRNGYWAHVQLPDFFKGKQINHDFQLFVMLGAFNLDAYVSGSTNGALRVQHAEWTNWNASDAVIQVRPCMQKIGIDTGKRYGWDAATTSPDAAANEGEADVIVFAQM